MTPHKIKQILYLTLIMLFTILIMTNTYAQPTGVQITYNQTETPDPTPAAEITTPGGSFTTMVLTGVFQTSRWKAYVGNVTGKLTLDDTTGSTIYDWNLAFVSGHVFVSRNNSISWGGISCASNTVLANEQTYLGINDEMTDSINKTFNQTMHKTFYVGIQSITNSTCKSIATYIGDNPQAPDENALFQQILLQDTNNNMIYATALEDAQQGYDLNPYDFQMIIPENPYAGTPTPYYFYAEIN